MRKGSTNPQIAAIFAKLKDFALPLPPYAPLYRNSPLAGAKTGTSLGGSFTVASMFRNDSDGLHHVDRLAVLACNLDCFQVR